MTPVNVIQIEICLLSHLLCNIGNYPMLGADTRFWLANSREVFTRISCLMSSAWNITRKERHWWRHNSEWRSRRPSSFLTTAMWSSNTVFIWWFRPDKRGIWDIKAVETFQNLTNIVSNGINSLHLVCFCGYGNLSTLSITIPHLAFSRVWYCDAACG